MRCFHDRTVTGHLDVQMTMRYVRAVGDEQASGSRGSEIKFRKSWSCFGQLAKTASVAAGCKSLKINGGAEGDRNPWPPHCELDDRHKRKYLPFKKLQPPKNIKGFAVLSHSLPAPYRAVLRILSTNWPQNFGSALVRQIDSHLRPRNGQATSKNYHAEQNVV
jgi:hypothetical protein